VLASERECPFCSSGLGPSAPRAVAGRALTRAAILFAGANVLSACGNEVVVMYGPASVDASADAADGQFVAMYGPAPIEDAAIDTSLPEAAPPPDAGDDGD
jgi:hypothetical protein